MNPETTKAPTDRPTMYGFPLAHWTIPADARTPLINRLHEDAYAVLTEPDGPIARQWADAMDEDGYRAITAGLTLPQVVGLVSELPRRTIVRLTGRAPSDAMRQEIVRMLYAPAEDD